MDWCVCVCVCVCVGGGGDKRFYDVYQCSLGFIFGSGNFWIPISNF